MRAGSFFFSWVIVFFFSCELPAQPCDKQLVSLMRTKPSILKGLPQSIDKVSDIVENAKTSGRDLRFHAAVAFIESLLIKRPHGLSTVLAARDFKELQAKVGMNEDQTLLALAGAVSGYSHPVLSEHPVGAAGILADERVVLGVNFELQAMPMNATIHGEQFVVVRAFALGQPLIKIAMSAEPCGHCRQVPPGDFGHYRTAVLPEEVSPKLSPAALLAVTLASKSYGPYSGKAAGLLIETADGEIFGGSHMDNVALNLSVDPFNAALVEMIAHYSEWSVKPQEKQGELSKMFRRIERITLAENRVFKGEELVGPSYGPYVEFAMKQLGIKASLDVIPIRILNE